MIRPLPTDRTANAAVCDAGILVEVVGRVWMNFNQGVKHLSRLIERALIVLMLNCVHEQ